MVDNFPPDSLDRSHIRKIVKPVAGTKISVEGKKVAVSGPGGQLQKDFYSPVFGNAIRIEQDGESLKIISTEASRKVKSEVGTIEANIKNMMRGVTDGWVYRLKVVYMHFPVTVKVEKDRVSISNFLGEKSPRIAKIVGGAKVDVKGDEITVSGIDLESVSQTAANLEKKTAIPARDRRVFQDGIFITEKPK